ncbi:MAG: response regulator [Proteobacteria bacterium]|nr:response regulator [Pseudomonadota bacterium]MBU1686929.1 response regulator [Pseudomonadota bacterium]
MADSERERILIVDDEPMVCIMLSRLLTEEGFPNFHAHSAKVALQLLGENDFALMLLDVQMPEMSGIELQKMVHLKYPELAVIMVSAETDHEVIYGALERGAFGYVVKPIDPLEVLVNIKNALRRRELEIDNRAYQMELEHLVYERTSELEKAYQDLKSSQERTIQQEKLAAIGQLAAGVAHEINNPTGYISSNLGTLLKYSKKLIDFINTQTDVCATGDDTEEKLSALKELRKKFKIDFIADDIKDLIDESLEGTERIKKIVQGLKNFSRKDENEAVMANINDCLENTLNIIWNELKYKSTVSKDFGELPELKCYPQQLSQVFMNLLVNAAHAIETRGEINLKTSHQNGIIVIAISDSGSGISEESLGKIFEPFFTTKPVGQGTGLGLSIVKEIVEKHHGTIEVTSEVGKGTCFTIIIPVSDPSAE